MKTNRRYLLKKSRHLSAEDVALYVDALRLDKVNHLPKAILNHVEDCTICKSEIINTYEIIKDEPIQTNDKEQPVYQNRSRYITLVRFTKIAAAIIILISLIFFIHKNYIKRIKQPLIAEKQAIPVDSGKQNNINYPANNMQTALNTKDFIKNPKQKNTSQALLAENTYKPSPLFESLIESHNRGKEKLEYIFPSDSKQFRITDSLHFKWKTLENLSLKITIYNNRNKIVMAKGYSSSDFFTYPPRLSAGLYYWKLESRKNLYHIGKFIIK